MAAEKGHQKSEISGFKKCFAALVDRKQVNLDFEVLKLIIKKELDINTDELEEPLVSLLPYMLVVYMKTWPGWKKSTEFFSGKISYKEFYNRFRLYVVLKLNYVIKTGYDLALKELEEEKKEDPNEKEAECQTDDTLPVGFAPFHIAISCPPKMMHNFLFTAVDDDTIRLSQTAETVQRTITVKELFNYPFIQVEFVSPELTFKRRNCTEYKRHIQSTSVPQQIDKPEFIQQIDLIEPATQRHSYTAKFISQYVAQYISVIAKIPEISSKHEFIDDIKILLNNFVCDIYEINSSEKFRNLPATMATNTSVTFNIGSSTFYRNSRSINGIVAESDVGYSEYLLPKINLSLISFTGVQAETEHVSFVSLNNLDNMIQTNKLSLILSSLGKLVELKFSCILCNYFYRTKEGIMDHLKRHHTMQKDIRCADCHVKFEVASLAGSRWSHMCQRRTGKKRSYRKSGLKT